MSDGEWVWRTRFKREIEEFSRRDGKEASVIAFVRPRPPLPEYLKRLDIVPSPEKPRYVRHYIET